MKIEEKKTKGKDLITESELISLMDKHGIGTDATIHVHIKTVQDRGYCVQEKKKLKPT